MGRSGVVTLRYHGRLHHIGIGRTHARTHVLLLIVDREHQLATFNITDNTGFADTCASNSSIF